jgi:hypothetical protein
VSGLRRGTTVIIVGGPDTGTIGKVTGGAGDRVYVDKAFGAHHQLKVVDATQVMKAPHSLAWYNGAGPDKHGPCEGCDDVQAAMNALRTTR